jgi:hypothetical protein
VLITLFLSLYLESSLKALSDSVFSVIVSPKHSMLGLHFSTCENQAHFINTKQMSVNGVVESGIRIKKILNLLAQFPGQKCHQYRDY